MMDFYPNGFVAAVEQDNPKHDNNLYYVEAPQQRFLPS